MTMENNPLNTSGIEPFEFKVLVRPDEVKSVTKGGIMLAQQTVQAMQFAICKGTLVALSPLAFNYDEGITDSDCPQPGARVLFAKYAGGEVEGRDGKTYRIMSDKDVMAFLTDETPFVNVNFQAECDEFKRLSFVQPDETAAQITARIEQVEAMDAIGFVEFEKSQAIDALKTARAMAVKKEAAVSAPDEGECAA